MAGPTVSVAILGDTKQFSQSVKDTGAQAEQASGRIGSAFSSMLGIVNQTGVLGPFGNALAAIGDQVDTLTRKGHDAGDAMLGIGGALVGVGFGLSVLGSKDQAARQQLAASIEATGSSWDDYSAKVEEAIKHNERFGDTADKTESALQILTQATGSPQQALTLLSTATDLAAAKHEDLTAAATQLGKIYNGNTKLLKQFGIDVTSSAAATKLADTATRQAVAADQAAANAKQRLADLEAVDAGRKKLTVTQAIALNNAEAKVTDTTNKAVAANKAATAAQKDATAAAKDGNGIAQLAQKTQGQAAAASDTATGKLKALTTAIEDQAAAFGNKYANAIQIGATALSGLGGAYKVTKGLIDKHNVSQAEAAAGAEKAAGSAGKLTKGLEAGGEAAAVAVPAVASFATGIGEVIALIVILVAAGLILWREWGAIWPAIKRYGGDAIDYIRGSWDKLIASIEGIPAAIGHIAHGMWDGIANAFVDMINFIIHAWNGLQFKIPSVGFGPFHTPSFTLGLPNIPDVPHLAQGGLITSTGLVYAHAGEAITPAPGRLGPAVAIENANFSSEVDVELFMRKAAWVVQTQRI